MSGIRVVVIDDHPIFRAGICERLNSTDGQIIVVGEGGDGNQAYNLAGALNPKVILMDISMPNLNGIEATVKIKNDFPAIEIILLSVYDDNQYVKAALQAGAKGYLLKTVEAAELIDSIARVAKGGTALSAPIAKKVFSGFSSDNEVDHGLSDREVQVLELAARGISNKVIAKELFLSSRTVDAHMRSVFDKLGVASRTEAVTHAVRHKLIELPGED